MARKASPLTLAIRQLCAQHDGNLTHGQARPMLSKLGIEIAAEPGSKSEDYLAFEPHAKSFVFPKGAELTQPNLDAYYEAVCRKAGLPPRKFAAVQAEDAIQRAFTNEQNNFDQTKFLWKRDLAGGPSAKPTTAVNVKSKLAAPKVTTVVSKPKVVGRPAKVVATSKDMTKALEAVGQIVKAGGVGAVKAKIVSLNAEVATLEALLAAAAPVQESLSDVA